MKNPDAVSPPTFIEFTSDPADRRSWWKTLASPNGPSSVLGSPKRKGERCVRTGTCGMFHIPNGNFACARSQIRIHADNILHLHPNIFFYNGPGVTLGFSFATKMMNKRMSEVVPRSIKALLSVEFDPGSNPNFPALLLVSDNVSLRVYCCRCHPPLPHHHRHFCLCRSCQYRAKA